MEAADLAAAVLARRDVRLALEVAGGSVTQAKAVQLAEVILGTTTRKERRRRAG
jgi:hypothetical protein